MRHNFNSSTKDTLAKRVNYLCSNPQCRELTVGPNSKLHKSTSIGVAAHISAASVGGPRFNNKLTEVERKSINNGIWLCSNCSTLIDRDPNLFTIETLKEWKEQTEKFVLDRIVIGSGASKLTKEILGIIKDLNSSKSIVRIVSNIFELAVLNNLQDLRTLSSRELNGWYSSELPTFDRKSIPEYRIRKVLISRYEIDFSVNVPITARQFMDEILKHEEVHQCDICFSEPISEIEDRLKVLSSENEQVMCYEIEKGQMRFSNENQLSEDKMKYWFLSSDYEMIILELKRYLNRKLMEILN